MKFAALIALVASMVLFNGCDEHPTVEAKYDALTGEKLPEKVDHLKDATAEDKVIDGTDFRYRIVRFVLEGHVYYSREFGESVLTHSEACPCKTNSVHKQD